MSFWKNRPLIITIILIIILCALLFSTAGTGNDGALSIVGMAIKPMQEGMYTASQSVGAFFGRLFASTDIDRENAQLKEELASYAAKQQTYDELEKENARLKELLNYRDSIGEYDTVTARVIGKNAGEWFRQITINVGRNDGVSENMIVLTSKGLLGKVVSCTDTYAKVTAFIDSTSGVAAIVERTRDNGIVRGTNSANSEQLLRLEHLAMDASVIPGDRVITSGIGGVYPKGLYIGQVSTVGSEVGSEKTIYIKSDVDFDHIEEVSVIRQIFSEVEE